jgi:uncharacterized protein (DUF1330 family)
MLSDGTGGMSMPSSQRDTQPMLPAYFIAEVEVIDPEEFKEYASRAADTAARYGGRYIVRGRRTDSLEGEPPKRIAISTWKSMVDDKRYYESPEYAEIIGIRHRACKSRVFIVEGLA